MRALTGAGFTSLHALGDVSRSELAARRGIGPKALQIIESALEEHGLKLA